MSPPSKAEPVPCLCGAKSFATWADLKRKIFVVRCSDHQCRFELPKSLHASDEAGAIWNWGFLIGVLQDSPEIMQLAEKRSKETEQ